MVESKPPAPKEGRWLAKPLKERLSYGCLSAFGAAIYVVPTLGYIVTHPDMERMPLWIKYLHGACMLSALLYYLVREYRCLRLTQGDVAQMERPEGATNFRWRSP